MDLYFDNDGPQITIKESNPDEVKVRERKMVAHNAALGMIQACALALTGVCLSFLIAPKVDMEQRIFAGLILLFGIVIGLLYFFRQYRDFRERESEMLNQRIWAADQASIGRLVGREFVLSPKTDHGREPMRIFYKDRDDMVCVWYSKGLYRYQKSTGEASIDFSNGIIKIPKYVWVPNNNTLLEE